jgi:branched-chain amino acid transport system substrate-binding protein
VTKLLGTRILIALGLGAVSLASGACRGVRSFSRFASRDTVYVGVAVGLKSPERYVNVFNGVQLALDDLNAKRPNGAPVLLLRRSPDSANTVARVAAAFRDDPAVIGVVGHTESDATINAGAVYDDRDHDGRNALVAVTPTANGTLVTKLNDWVFRVCPPVIQQAQALARFAHDSMHVSSVAVVYRNDASGKDFSRAFAAAFKTAGGAIVERDPFVEEAPEFDAYAIRLTRRGARAVVFSGNAPEALTLIRAVHGAHGAPAFLATNPPAGALDSGAARDFRGMRYVALYSPDEHVTSASAPFAEVFSNRFHSPPDHWAALGYDAAMLIGRAVHAVGPDRRRIRDWIASVGRTVPAYEGVTGQVRFDGEGDPVDKHLLVKTMP